MSIDKNLYAGINATYIRSLLLSAGFSNTDLPPKPLVLVQKLEDYLQSYDWTVDWYDSIDPTKLNDKLLSLYDELSDVRDMKLDELNTVDVDSVVITDAIEPVRDDVKLLSPVIEPLPVEVIVPQEVVSEPQEDLSLSTTTNEDKTMSIILPDFSTNGNTFTLVPVEFTSIWYEVPTVDVVELNGQYSELTCDVLSGQCSDVLEGWIGKTSDFACHYSDGWYGQCCDLADAPKPVEQLSDAQYRVQQACAKMARRSAYASPVRYGTPVNTTPTITTKSGKVVPVSPHAVTPHGNAPVSSRVTSPKVTSAIGEASAIDPVDEYKSTLFNLNDYDITRNIVVDVATTTPATPKAPATPKPSTAKFANNFNSLVMAKYRELSNGIIKDSLVLNKLTSALRANNIEAYNKYVTTFNNPQAVALHRQAYDAVVSAS